MQRVVRVLPISINVGVLHYLLYLLQQVALNKNSVKNGWGFTTDKDGVTRPGTGLNWSMGAYEP